MIDALISTLRRFDDGSDMMHNVQCPKKDKFVCPEKDKFVCPEKDKFVCPKKDNLCVLKRTSSCVLVLVLA